MIIDILQAVSNSCNLKTQLKIGEINLYTYHNIYIHNLVAPHNMTIPIFHQKKFSMIKSLNSLNNNHISDLEHLSNTLEALFCERGISGDCKINKSSISKLKKLRILSCIGNKNISSVNCLADTLEELYCSGSIISQFGISKLRKLTHLGCSMFIENVDHLANTLIVLDCSNTRYFGQNDIIQLINLKKLILHDNNKIIDINHLAETLEELDCGGSKCSLNQNGITQLKKIRIFSCNNNTNINNVNHLAETLEELDCGGSKCSLSQNGIAQLKKIKIFSCGFNPNIWNVNHLSDTLEILDCRYCSGINQMGISKLKNLKKIRYTDNSKINIKKFEKYDGNTKFHILYNNYPIEDIGDNIDNEDIDK